MEFSKPLKKFRDPVKSAFATIMSKKISSFLHANVRAPVLSFIQNALNNGSIVRSKRKSLVWSKHTILTNFSAKFANTLTQEWLFETTFNFK